MVQLRGSSLGSSKGLILRGPRVGKQSSPWHPLLLGVVMGLMLAFLLFRRPGNFAFDFFDPQEITLVKLLELSSFPPKDNDLQPDIATKASRKLFSTLPKEKERTFFADITKPTQPFVRTLRHLGWIKVDEMEDARLIYTNERDIELFGELEPWQRYNHIPRTSQWADRARFAKGFREYAETAKRPQYFLPETYDLHVDSQRKEFQERLSKANKNWIVKSSTGNVHTIKPDSKTLTTEMGEVVQEFICNEMLWDDANIDANIERTLELRVYWFVASLDPLLVFYMDGFVRIGNSNSTNGEYNLGEMAPWPKFEHGLWQQVRRLGNPNPVVNPINHVRSQLKESLSQLIDAFKEKTFATGGIMSAEDAFELYTADYLLDTDLDVWLMKARADNCTSSFEDHYFMLDMHHRVFYGMAMILDEIWDKQAKGLPILPLHNTGKWEMIYANGWMFEYQGYERSHNKCSIAN